MGETEGIRRRGREAARPAGSGRSRSSRLAAGEGTGPGSATIREALRGALRAAPREAPPFPVALDLQVVGIKRGDLPGAAPQEAEARDPLAAGDALQQEVTREARRDGGRRERGQAVGEKLADVRHRAARPPRSPRQGMTIPDKKKTERDNCSATHLERPGGANRGASAARRPLSPGPPRSPQEDQEMVEEVGRLAHQRPPPLTFLAAFFSWRATRPRRSRSRPPPPPLSGRSAGCRRPGGGPCSSPPDRRRGATRDRRQPAELQAGRVGLKAARACRDDRSGPAGRARTSRASPSQSAVVSTTSRKFPEVSPFFHGACRERLQKCAWPVARVLSTASRSAQASISTAPLPTSWTTTGISPRSSKRSRRGSSASLLGPAGRGTRRRDARLISPTVQVP